MDDCKLYLERICGIKDVAQLPLLVLCGFNNSLWQSYEAKAGYKTIMDLPLGFELPFFYV